MIRIVSSPASVPRTSGHSSQSMAAATVCAHASREGKSKDLLGAGSEVGRGFWLCESGATGRVSESAEGRAGGAAPDGGSDSPLVGRHGLKGQRDAGMGGEGRTRLPRTVLRRLEAVPEDSKKPVRDMKSSLDQGGGRAAGPGPATDNRPRLPRPILASQSACGFHGATRFSDVSLSQD